MGFLNLKVLIGRYALLSLNFLRNLNSMLEIRTSMALIDHLKNHLSDLLQTHESYQIQWESRLDDAAALCRKEN